MVGQQSMNPSDKAEQAIWVGTPFFDLTPLVELPSLALLLDTKT